MKNILLGFMAMAGLFFIAMPVSAAAAWNPFGETCNNSTNSSEVETSAVCKDSNKQVDSGKNENPLTGSDGLIIRIANLVAFVAGAAAVIIIILAGLRMVTSSGSSDDVAGARRSLIYAVVGLIVIALARVIIGFIIGAL